MSTGKPHPRPRRIAAPMAGRTHDRPRPGRAQPRYQKHEEGQDRLPRGVLIVHEDDDLIVVDKPPGLLSADPDRKARITLFDIVKDHVRAGKKRGGRTWIIHRLDRDASGLIVFAKSEKAFTWLKEDFRAKRVHRLYVALVEGEITAPAPGEAPAPPAERQPGEAPPPDHAAAPTPLASPEGAGISGTIQSFLEEDEEGEIHSVRPGETLRPRAPGQRQRPEPTRPTGPAGPRLAVTHYRVLGVGQGRSLLQVRLQTGRRNQIRIHMKEFGHPLVGDLKYGSKSDPIRRLGLHAKELGFTHPGTGQTVRYFSPAPPIFYRAAGQTPPPRQAPAPASRSDGDRAPPALSPAAAASSWDHVAEWYDSLVEEGRSDHFEQVIMPGTLRLLSPAPGVRVLDVACGQGALARRLAASGAQVVGIDASERLIAAARARTENTSVRFDAADAREIEAWARASGEAPFDAVTCVMSLMNIEPVEPVLRGAASVLRPGGALVAVILHPGFRSPGQTSWGWDESQRGNARQYRRVDGYLSPGHREITMNPGQAARGGRPITTVTYHRPIQSYVKAFADAGFLISAIEEWPSARESRPGPRAAEENRARREIPLFLGFRAMRQVPQPTESP